MRRTLRFAFIPLALLVGDSAVLAQAADPGPRSANPSPIEEPTPLYASATRLDRIGRVVAPVMINGQGPYRLVVDTGASHSTFSPRLAQALGLTPSFDTPLLMNGVTGTAEVPTVSVDRIQAGDLVVQRANVPVVWSSIMADADGILGVAGLHGERIFVDFRHDKIVITRSRSKVDTTGFLKIPARRVEGGLLQVEAQIGGVTAKVVIDTGAERTLGNLALRNALRNAELRKNRDGRWADAQVYGATEQVAQGQSSITPAIKLGPAVISDTEVIFGDFHIFKVWHMDKRPAALVGMDVLGTVQALVVDYQKREVYFEVPTSRKVARE